MARIEVPLRAVIENPPPGVAWALQRSKGDLSELEAPTSASAEALVWDFEVRAEPAPDGGVRLTGPFIQGPADDRFFYLNSGTYAGAHDPIYGRRAKLKFKGLTWAAIEALKPGQRLEVRMAGKGKDGGPACATVPLLAPAWRVVD